MNNRIVRLVIVMALLAAPATRLFAGNYSWTTTGPEPGQVFQILTYASDPNRLYVVDSYFGGYLFRSDDQGRSWCYLEKSVGDPVVADPTNPNVLYAPVPQRVAKTTDGGTSWASAGVGLTGSPSSLVIAPSDPSVLYAFVNAGTAQLFRSDDGAATWHSVVPNAAPQYWTLTVDAFDSNTVYAIVAAEYWRSIDGGATWSPVGGGLPTYAHRLVSDLSVQGVVWALTAEDGLFKSSDGGLTYVPSQVGMEGQYVRDMAFDRAHPGTLYAAAMGTSSGPGGLFVSHDAGDSWEPVDLGIDGPHQATAVAVDPSGSARLYVGAGLGLHGGLLRSVDAGNTWTRSQRGLSGYTTYAIATHPSLPNSAFGSSGAQLFGTLDAGANWAPLPSPAFTITSLLYDPSNLAILYGQYSGYENGVSYGGVYKSVNGGGSWTDASTGLSGTTSRRLAIGVSDPSVLLASNEAGIWKTSSGGDSWENLLSDDGRAVAIDPADPTILYASRSSSSPSDRLVRSDDGGLSWNPPSGLPDYAFPWDIAIPPGDATTVYALTNNAVYKSTDRGLTFQPASEGLPDGATDYYRLRLDPSAPQTLYASTGVGGAVFRTIDGAATWRLLGKSIPALTVLDFNVSATGRDLYAATVAGVFQFHRGFQDVPDSDGFWSSVDAAAMTGVTAGCGGGRFCPAAPNTRAQIAPMLLRAIEGAAYLPPAATGTVFGDVSATSFAAAWIEELARRDIAAGCGSGDYCPSSPMTRAALAVLLLKAKHGSDYEPPPATGTVFLDVPADAFAAAWIEELAAEGITAGCGGGNFCPNETVLRSQAVTLIVKTFGLS